MKLTESYLRKVIKEELKKVLVKEQQEVEQNGGLSNVELGVLDTVSFVQNYAANNHFGSASANAIQKDYNALAARSNGLLSPVTDIRPILAGLVQKGFIAMEDRLYYTTETGNNMLMDNDHPVLDLTRHSDRY